MLFFMGHALRRKGRPLTYEDLYPYLSLGLNTIILGFIIFGVTQRRNRRVHVPVMLGCFVADLALVVMVELTRQVFYTTFYAEKSLILKVHLCFSIPLVGVWIAQVILGFMRLKGRMVRAHRVTAVILLILRTGNCITAFFV